MKTSKVVLTSLAATTISALPSIPIVAIRDLAQRSAERVTSSVAGRSVASGIVGLAILIAELIQGGSNAYDPGTDGTCILSFSTYAGSDCQMAVQCGDIKGTWQWDAATIVPGPGPGWNSCYLNGVQYLNHPDIGDFSIEFTEAGGIDGNTEDGLHHPHLKVATIGDWADIDVQMYADQANGGQKDGNICHGGGSVPGTQTITWECGVPQLGSQYLQLSNDPPVTATTYAPGTCGIHFYDYQIPSGDTQYYVALRIVDNDGTLIGQVGNSYSNGEDRVSAAAPVDVDSDLPYVLIYTRPGAMCSNDPSPGSDCDTSDPDEAAITFAYAGDTWRSDDSSRCSVGAFDSGARQGDCTFAC